MIWIPTEKTPDFPGRDAHGRQLRNDPAEESGWEVSG
jgi:hypothetical protein